MTWTQLHERMAFMAAVIDKATEDPEAALNFNGTTPDVERLFGGEEGLLLSLRQRWLTMLTARLDQAEHEGVPAERAVADLVAAQPGLHALLDVAAQRSARVANLRAGEQRIVDLYGSHLPDTRVAQTVGWCVSDTARRQPGPTVQVIPRATRRSSSRSC